MMQRLSLQQFIDKVDFQKERHGNANILTIASEYPTLGYVRDY